MRKLLYAIVLTLPLSAANIVQNPSFDVPVLGSTFATFPAGDFLSPWVYAGPGSGLLLRSDYTEPGLIFPSHSGTNSLDLTGPGWTGANEIYQDLSTTIGSVYTLTFWLGNQDDSHPSYSQPSEIEVLINGVSIGTASASHSGTPSVLWSEKSFGTIIATGTTTRLTFRNITATNDAYLGLDDVSFDAQPSAVPEPSTFALAGMAFGALALRRYFAR